MTSEGRDLPWATTTAFLDTENVFHWTHPNPPSAGKERRSTVQLLNLAEWGHAVRHRRRVEELMGLGVAVLDRLTQWFDEQTSGAFDLRSYSKQDDPAAEVVGVVLAAHAEGAPAKPGDWVHIEVGAEPDAADREIAQDLTDRSENPEPQRFYVVSSDLGEVLTWAKAIAVGADRHDYRVILGPRILHPYLVAAPALAPMRYVGTIAEIFRQVVSVEKARKQGDVEKAARVPLRLTASSFDLSLRYAQQHLSADAVRLALRDSKDDAAFVARLQSLATRLDALPGLGTPKKESLADEWPAQVLAAWQGRDESMRSSGGERAPLPAYASPTEVPRLVMDVEGRVAFQALVRSIWYALDHTEGDVAEARTMAGRVVLEWIARAERAVHEI